MKNINLNKKNLAINGGNPVRILPWLDNFTTGEEEKKAVIRVMDKGYLSLFEGSHTPDAPFAFEGGPEVIKLESAWCKYYDSNYAVSMNSATSCLYAAIGALGIGYGDEVIVSPYTMTACATAPLIYGAIPVFADVELETGSISPECFEKLISKRTKAIIVVHQFGIPANMEAIMNIAKKHSISVIEDCAQSHGAKYKNQFVGTIGHIGIFSLNVNKTIQAGEGGICITNDSEISFRLQLIRNHGEAVVEGAGYENITNMVGFNYRLTEIQAAIASCQLKKLNKLNSERIDFINHLNNSLKDIEFLSVPKDIEGSLSTFYLYPLRFLKNKTNVSRSEFVNALNAEGMMFYQGYSKPLYLQPLYKTKSLYKYNYPFSAVQNENCYMNYEQGICPNAEMLYFEQMIINEHIRPPNTIEDMNDILMAFKKVVDV